MMSNHENCAEVEYVVISRYIDGTISTEYVNTLEEAKKAAYETKCMTGAGFDHAVIALVQDFVD